MTGCASLSSVRVLELTANWAGLSRQGTWLILEQRSSRSRCLIVLRRA